jgi:predicted ester cyclase
MQNEMSSAFDIYRDRAIEIVYTLNLPSELERKQELHEPDVYFHSPVTVVRGYPALLNYIRILYDAFPDIRVAIEYAVSDGQRAAVRATLRGTFLRDISGMVATGRKMVMPQMLLFRFAGDKVAEIEVLYDTRILAEELGAVPPSRSY